MEEALAGRTRSELTDNELRQYVKSHLVLCHLAITADRVECVKALDTTLQAPNGTHIKDALQFFNGDKVAQWIEGRICVVAM